MMQLGIPAGRAAGEMAMDFAVARTFAARRAQAKRTSLALRCSVS
jgi:hypothetical protein